MSSHSRQDDDYEDDDFASSEEDLEMDDAEQTNPSNTSAAAGDEPSEQGTVAKKSRSRKSNKPKGASYAKKSAEKIASKIDDPVAHVTPEWILKCGSLIEQVPHDRVVQPMLAVLGQHLARRLIVQGLQ